MASVVPSTPAFIGFMLKDVGGRLAMISHNLKTTRFAYPVCRHQNVKAFRCMVPWTQDAAFIAPNAMVMGNVALGHDTAVFYHACIRNLHTRDPTRIGDHSVIMERVSFLGQVKVGHNTLIAAGATLDCCQIHDNVYIGPGASIALGAVVENGAIVAAGSVVDKDVRIPAGELWAGAPAEKIADVTPAQMSELKHMIHFQIKVAKEHLHAIHDHVHATEELSSEWLNNVVQQLEAQQQQVKVHTSVDFPVEAKRFMEPRVYQRRPEMHMRMSYPVNRIAPWMPRSPDAVANA